VLDFFAMAACPASSLQICHSERSVINGMERI
jgi:hypothetical protein